MKAKAKADKFTAKATAIRVEMESVLVKAGESNAAVTFDDVKITMKRAENYSIPAAAFTDIITTLPKDAFKLLFNTSYKLKKARYDELSDGKMKKAIKKHLTIKPSPLSVSVKEIE